MKPVFCFGEALVDFIPDESGMYQPFAGGAPANVAAAVSRLGGESYFVGGISRDNMGRFLLNELNVNGVNTDFSAFKPNKTALALVTLNQGERSFDFYRDDTADTALNKADISSVNLDSDGIVHFCSNTLTTASMAEVTHELLNRARQARTRVSFDVNLRLNLWSADNSAISRAVERCFRFSDIVKLAGEELDYLSRQRRKTQREYIELIQSLGAELIMVTDGGNSIAWYTQDHFGAVEPAKVTPVDTTAAGDSFAGGFLYQLQRQSSLNDLLINIEKLSQAIQFASECGAYTVRHYGSFSALPGIKDVG